MASKVLVTEKIAEEGLDILKGRGYEVVELLDAAPDDLASAIVDADALIVRSATRVTPELLDGAKNLKIIGRAGVTVDNIDVDAANERGIIVCNAPTSNIVSAAEHTMALLLACARRIPQADASMHAGSWERAAFTGTELYQKTLAIFGLGRIGSLVAERARAFGMELIAYDPYCSPDRAAQLDVTLVDSISDILPIADVITIHLPLTQETYGMFGAEEYAAMKTEDSCCWHRRVRERTLRGQPLARIRRCHPHAAHQRGHARSAGARWHGDRGVRVGGPRGVHRAHGHQYVRHAP